MASAEVYGATLARLQFANFTVTIATVGIQLFMCCYGLAVYLEAPRATRRGRRPYIILGFTILLLSAMAASLDMYLSFHLLWGSADGVTFLNLARKANNAWHTLFSISCFLGTLMLGDGLLLYRCYVLWSDKPWVVILPGLMYLSMLGLGIKNNIRLPGYTPTPVDFRVVSAFHFIAPIFNLIVTGIISFRLLRARRALKSVFSTQHLKTYSRITIILLEAALPPSLFGFAYGVTLAIKSEDETDPRSGRNIAEWIFSMLYFAFATLAPQMIIFQVTIGRSWRNPTDTDTMMIPGSDATRSTQTALRFAKSEVDSVGDHRHEETP